MSGNVITPLILNCTPEDFVLVKKYIAEFCLDDNDLNPEQFLVAKMDSEVIGFGRLRAYSDCFELCSLGVIPSFRRKGIGSALTEALIQKSSASLYTVTIIPEFFSRFGFKVLQEFPIEIETKLKYCISALSVPEPYMVMKHF
jgi:amino-acid N-acetyltransferase